MERPINSGMCRPIAAKGMDRAEEEKSVRAMRHQGERETRMKEVMVERLREDDGRAKAGYG
jgi:hypothetical protein